MVDRYISVLPFPRMLDVGQKNSLIDWLVGRTMQINTPLSEALGTDIPLLLAPMAGGPTTAQLVSAVSNAGAFGQFGAAYLNGEKIRFSAGEIRTQTNKGFGVNLFIPEEPPYTPDDLRAATSAISPHCK